MSASVVVALLSLAFVAAGVIGLRRLYAKTDAQRHQLGLVAAIFVVLCCTTFLDEQHNYVALWQVSIIDLLRQTTMLSLIAVGAAVVIIAGGIDLSAGSVIAFSASTCASLMVLMAPDEVNQSQPVGLGVIVLAVTGTLIVGLLIGSLHAWLITEVGLPPFVATLGTLVGLRSLSRAIVQGVTLTMLGGSRTQINVADKTFRELAGAVSGTVWSLTIISAALAAAVWLLLGKTVTGRHLYALGGNEQAAILSGIQTKRLKWLAYCISAFLSSVAGVLAVSQTSVADPQTLARGYELNAIAAAVVGGCSLQGGVGTIPGTLLGTLFLRVVIDGVAKIIKTDADVYEGLIVGVLVVFAVTFTKTSDKSSVGRRKLFAGALGWVTIFNLTILAGVLTALLSPKLVKGRLQMDAAWLAVIIAASTLTLLLIVRTSWSSSRKRQVGVVWAIATICSVVGLDFAYPRVQRSRAVGIVREYGGSVSQSPDGSIVVNLDETHFNDAGLKRLLPGLKFFPNLAELRLRKTDITDAGLDTIGKQMQGTQSLKRLDATESKVSSGGVTRLKRSLSHLEVQP